jgi:hypothetical protein
MTAGRWSGVASTLPGPPDLVSRRRAFPAGARGSAPHGTGASSVREQWPETHPPNEAGVVDVDEHALPDLEKQIQVLSAGSGLRDHDD